MPIFKINNDVFWYNNYTDAANELSSHLEEQLKNGNFALAGEISLEIAECFYRLNTGGDFLKAFREAHIFFQLSGHTIGLIKANLQWAKYLRVSVRLQESNQYFYSAKALSIRHKHKVGYWDSLCGIAENMRIMGDVNTALYLHKKLLKSFLTENNPTGIIWALLGIGQIYRTMNCFRNSLEYFKEAEKRSIAYHDTKNLAFALKGLGEVYTLQNRSLYSIELLQQAINLFNNINYKVGLGYSHKTLADSLLHLGFVKEAEMEIAKSQKIFTQIRDHRGIFYAKKGFADVNYSMGNFSLSKSVYNECLSFFSNNGINYGFSETRKMIRRINYLMEKN